MAFALQSQVACTSSQASTQCANRQGARPIAGLVRRLQQQPQPGCSRLAGSRPCLRRSAAQLTTRAVPGGHTEDVQLPDGYVWYETMIVLRPDMTDEERDVELAKFEAFLNKTESKHVKALVRGRQRLSYPMKGFWDGIYVLYTYASKRSVSQSVQKMLSTPVVGAENNILRHLTFCS